MLQDYTFALHFFLYPGLFTQDSQVRCLDLFTQDPQDPDGHNGHIVSRPNPRTCHPDLLLTRCNASRWLPDSLQTRGTTMQYSFLKFHAPALLNANTMHRDPLSTFKALSPPQPEDQAVVCFAPQLEHPYHQHLIYSPARSPA